VQDFNIDDIAQDMLELFENVTEFWFLRHTV